MKAAHEIPVSALIAMLLTLSVGSVCEAEVKDYQVQEASGTLSRALSVYLSSDYESSGMAYPVLYLLHGVDGNNLTFLGGGYGGFMSDANVSIIADRLIQEKRISPLIIVCPDLGTVGIHEDYIVRTLVPFVDKTFRTIPRRESRAIAGHSMGGYRSLLIALGHPESFGLAGGLSSFFDMYKIQEIEELLKEYNRESNPILFWLYAGRQDQYRVTQPNRDVVQLFRTHALPTTYLEDDGDHTREVPKRLGEFLEYISGALRR